MEYKQKNINNLQGLLPQARNHQLVTRELPDEVLVYDLNTDKAYCLNHTAAFVWQHADGQTPVKQIAHLLERKLKTPVDEAIIWFALESLEKDGLLKHSVFAPQMFAGMNRRQLISAVGKSAAVALPLVFAITAPMPANAQSSALLANGAVCAFDSECSSSICGSNGTCCSSSTGASCVTNADCCSDSCVGGICGGGGGGGGGCLLYDTPITTAGGQTVRAIDVAIGENLLGVNCLNGETIAGRVKEVMKYDTQRVYSIVAENGAVVNCSPSHPLISGFGDKDGKAAELFQTGDLLLVFDAKSQKIVEARTAAISCAEIRQPVVIFEMDTVEHTFLSGGIVSHNRASKA